MLVAASQKRSTMPSFRAPSVQANSSGWGPAEAPSQYDELPFSTFSRSERIGRAADWTNASGSHTAARGTFLSLTPHSVVISSF